MIKIGLWLLTSLASMAPVTPLIAQPLPISLGRFQDWDAYEAGQDRNTYCYILSTPKTQSSDQAHISITRFTRRGLDRQVNINFGTAINGSTPVYATIDGQNRFELSAHESTGGWFADVRTEERFVEALRKGEWLIVEAQQEGGQPLRHRYSLFGITAAHNDVNKRCS